MWGLPLAWLCAACRAQNVEADVQALNALQRQVDEAIISGNMDRYMTFLSDDAVLMPPNASSVVGKEAIRSWNVEMARRVRIDAYRSVDAEVVVSGDWAFRRATYEWTATPMPTGTPARDSGKYIIVYKRRADGSWSVARDIWNGSTPPARR
jgi:ketosteroid isomerase-like protein